MPARQLDLGGSLCSGSVSPPQRDRRAHESEYGAILRAHRMDRGATLSECGMFRYRLHRVWRTDLPTCVWLLLNPSIANGTRDDPTAKKVVVFSHHWGFGSAVILNPFAAIATKPSRLLELHDPIGPDNREWLRSIAHPKADTVVLGWGDVKPRTLHALLYEVLRSVGIERGRGYQCLGRTAGGDPRHPLMLSYDTPLEPW